MPKISSYIPYLISLAVDRSIIYLNIQATQQRFTCSNATIEITFEKGQNMQLTIKRPEQHNWHHSGVVIVNLEDVSLWIVGSSPLAAVMPFFCLKYFFTY